MAKNSLGFLLFFMLMNVLYAKNQPEKYIVYFKDKPTCADVQKQFSEQAIAKRKKIDIAFDYRDFPINQNYIKQLENRNVLILQHSNWLNAVLVQANKKQISNFPFIQSIAKVPSSKNKSNILSEEESQECEQNNAIQEFEDGYTSSFPQTHLLNGEYLHEQGFNGENMTIAICDNGFYNVDSNVAFRHIFESNKLLGTFDYVHNDSLVYDESGGAPNFTSHGSNCLSFIAGKIDSQYIGTSTESNFYLFHTENNSSERLQEEFNLAAALERCSQIGVDVVSISLGYTTFDVPSENHDTSDMRTNSTPAAIAVNIASSKGMLVCVAAGNEGVTGWKYISSPADADSAFTIGSVDINGNVASSSGYGMPNDSRVKPNIAAMGVNAKYIRTNGTISTGGGTSYATPQIAGLAACLWQAFPSKTNWEIKTAIEQSSSQYLTPNDRIGYGIPDFKKAYQILATPTFISSSLFEKEFSVFPNPFHQTISINHNGNADIKEISILDNVGREVFSLNSVSTNTIDLSALPTGLYLMRMVSNKGILIKKILKN
ncbi:MAG: S8 family peptidase [Bacteroidetes bacterium]|nr:S8 family peptidase [Bacteroidota bacterium]